MRNEFTKLPLTDEIMALLAHGKRTDAKRLHDATVKAAFKAAENGAIINLSDLMASKEQIDLGRK